MKRKLPAVIGASVAIAAGTWLWLGSRTADRVAAWLPATPEMTSSPPALQDRINAASARARSRSGASRGFAELARLYHANGFLDEAQRCYRGLQELEPREPRWPHLQATILAGYGDLEPALALWRRVTELAPDYVPARLRLADSLFKSNQRDQAAAAYAEVLKRDRDNPYAELGLARLDLEASRWDQARSRLERVVSKTNYTLGYDLIVSLYERLGLAPQAAAIRAMTKASGAYRDPEDPWLDRLIDDCLDPYRLSLAAGTTARNGDAATALKLLERAVSVAPDDVSVRFQLGTLLVAQGQLDAARTQLERCTVLAPDFADGWAHLSSLLARQGRNVDASRVLAEGLKNCPQSPGLHLMLARNHQQAGLAGAAITEFQTSIELRPNEAEAYLELAQLYIRLNRTPEGVEQLRRALKAEPGNPNALGLLAMNAIVNGNEKEARDWFASVRAQPRSNGDLINHLADAYRKKFGREP